MSAAACAEPSYTIYEQPHAEPTPEESYAGKAYVGETYVGKSNAINY